MFAASKSGSAAEPTDAQFNYVTMLLHGNGTNGAQNNTFVDSSTNNFTITRNGNTTQGTFSPYGSNWSIYSDGSGDSVTAPSNTAFAFGTGDFTIEFWAFIPSWTNEAQLIGAHTAFVGLDWLFQQWNSGEFRWLDSSLVLQSGYVPPTNQWNHYACTRSGTTLRIFVNGVQRASGTSTANIGSTKNVGMLGDTSGAQSQIGYMSNVRIVKGTALYTSAFTPSTTPLTAISGTSLLTCQANRFADASANAFTITVNGNTSVQRFSPFSPTTADSTSVIGVYGYFDGSGDYLTVTGATTALAFGSNDFTIEFWGLIRQTTPEQMFIDWRPAGTQTTQPLIYVTGSGVLAYYVNAANRITGATLSTNQWYHIAVCRSGTSTKMFLNGVQTGSTWTDTTVYTNTSTRPVIGLDGNTTNSGYLNGYVTDIRTITGTALYTTTFTPPTAPLTAITNTSLLLNYTNAGILDNAMMNDLETVGNAQISTSVKKYGTGSMYFDGTDDRLNMPSSPNFAFGTGDFTLEMWAYFTSTANFPTLTDSRSSTGSTSGFNLGLSSAKVQLYTTSQLLIGSSTLSTNTWYHIAITRASGTLKIWLNGTQDATVSNSTNWSDQTFVVGATPNAANFMTGYIDDLRITKGYARYTANFTAPTAAFPDKG